MLAGRTAVITGASRGKQKFLSRTRSSPFSRNARSRHARTTGIGRALALGKFHIITSLSLSHTHTHTHAHTHTHSLTLTLCLLCVFKSSSLGLLFVSISVAGLDGQLCCTARCGIDSTVAPRALFPSALPLVQQVSCTHVRTLARAHTLAAPPPRSVPAPVLFVVQAGITAGLTANPQGLLWFVP